MTNVWIECCELSTFLGLTDHGQCVVYDHGPLVWTGIVDLSVSVYWRPGGRTECTSLSSVIDKDGLIEAPVAHIGDMIWSNLAVPETDQVVASSVPSHKHDRIEMLITEQQSLRYNRYCYSLSSL